MLDNVARFVGQRIAAVVADTEAAAEEGCRKLEVEYEILPAVFDPEEAMRPGAPQLHDKGVFSRAMHPEQNIFLELHGEIGSVEEGFREADAIYEDTYDAPRQQHVHLETMQSVSWRGDDGRYHIRTSVQGPFIVKSKLCFIFGLNLADLHVFCERVGGGFGGKQDMMSEDLPLLATLKLGRPVMWEFTREEQFTGATTKHPMKTHVKIGAKKDGRITAIQYRVVSNTGAYGNHGGETLANGMSGPWAIYKCPNKKGDGYAVYTNLQCGGGFRGYGTSQTTFAVECAVDELARMLEIDPLEFRRKNVVGPVRQHRIGLERGDATSRWAATAWISASISSRPRCAAARPPQTRRRALAGRHRRRALDARLRSADRAALGLRVRAARRRHAITLPWDRPRSATGSSPRSSRSSRRSWAARPRA